MEQQERVRRRFVVAGRVQGVGFRGWILRRATELQLRGRVRNLADGTVEIEAEGSAPDLERLRELLYRGPPLARVRAVRELSATKDALSDVFDVVY